ACAIVCVETSCAGGLSGIGAIAAILSGCGASGGLGSGSGTTSALAVGSGRAFCAGTGVIGRDWDAGLAEATLSAMLADASAGLVAVSAVIWGLGGRAGVESGATGGGIGVRSEVGDTAALG